MYVKYQVIGSQNVAVPTHFFKIILCESKNGEYELQSYVMPNAYCDKSTPLSNYLVPLDSIERSAGFIFFDRLQRPKLKTINGKSV
jgi:endonuclease G